MRLFKGFQKVKPETAAVPGVALSDLARMRTSDLLALHAEIGAKLRDRGVTRSANNPTGDYGEYLFSKAFGWQLASNSNAKFDAVDTAGNTYQIKARRMTGGNHISRQLGVIRNLTDGGFDYLAAVLLRPNYEVERGLIIPHSALAPISRYSEHQNGWILRLDDAHWSVAGVVDATAALRGAALQLD